MSNPTIPQGPAAPTFDVFKAAHASVVETRDKLRVLAVLSQPEGDDEEGDAREASSALAWCYSRLAGELDDVVEVNAALPEGLRV